MGTVPVAKMKNVDRIAVAFCLAALLYVVTGFCSRGNPKTIIPDVIKQLNLAEPVLSGRAFALHAIPDFPRPEEVKGPLALYGSFVGGGDSMGSVRSASFKAVPDFYMFVSGFPNRPGNQLAIEVQMENGDLARLRVSPFEDMAERWVLKRISLRPFPGATSFRILATDGNRGPEGWLAFSLPFEDRDQYGRHGLLIPKQLALSVLATVAAFVALLAPGFLLRDKWRSHSGRLFSFIWVAVPGMLGLAVLATLAWLSLPRFEPASICRFGLAIFFALTLWCFLRVRFSSLVTKVELRVLAVVVALIAICVAKSIYSLGPVGELYHDEIRRTLEIGGRSDSRFPYNVSQLVGRQNGPNSPLAGILYGTWTFSDRGQLVALAAAPLVLAGPTKVPGNQASDPWTVFDPQGFAAYRFCMITFAASGLLFVFGIARLFLSEQWSLFAVLVTAGTPFFLHETYFTWPKLEAAAFVLLAGYLVLRARFLLAGLALGLAYMCHPAALLSVPALLGVIVLVPKFRGSRAAISKRIYQWAKAAILLLLGLAVWIGFWRAVNAGHYSQTAFLGFLTATGHLPKTPMNWVVYRLDSLLNTFVPLNQFFFYSTDDNVNALEGPSPAIVRFFVQPWSAVPFAVGFAFFFCQLPLLYTGFKKARSWLILTLVIPLLVFAAYMGVDRSGLLKDGMHAWFLTLMIFTVIVWKKYRAGSQRFFQICNWALLSRAADILLMMLLPVVCTQHSIVRPPFVLTDVFALCVMIAGSIFLCVWTFRVGEQCRVAENSMTDYVRGAA